jgi:acyl-coenzyme A thioesterase PaaI-like protein
MTTSGERIDLQPHDIPFIYGQVGARTRSLSEDSAAGTLTVRDDLRVWRGPSAAALAVLLQDLSAVTVARFAPLIVPVQIDVRIRPSALTAAELSAEGTTLYRGRTIMATEAQVVDAADPTRMVAFLMASWATLRSNLDVPKERLIGPGAEESHRQIRASSLLEAIGATVRDDHRGCELGDVAPEHTEPIALGGSATQTLHAGALQVLAEGAASIVAGDRVDPEQWMIEDLSTKFVRPARSVPLAAIGEVVSMTATELDVRVEVREEAGAGSLCALSFARFGLIA